MHRLSGICFATKPVYRTFATAAGSTGAAGAAGALSRTAGRPSRLGGKAVLSLDHFLQRRRALALYRTIVRGTRQISDATTRAETLQYARAEFERHRGVTDLVRSSFWVTRPWATTLY
ncbi:MAG: hypothetical protein SEPTF4163_003982 [Sporothrix epigloea]